MSQVSRRARDSSKSAGVRCRESQVQNGNFRTDFPNRPTHRPYVGFLFACYSEPI